MVNIGKVLIVEDDDFKADAVKEHLSKNYLFSSLNVAKSVQHAIATIDLGDFNLVILDMSLPSHNLVRGGGSPVSFLSGGVEVLSEIIDSGRDEKIIILTQFEEIEFNGILMSHEKFTEAVMQEQNYNIFGVIYFQRNTEVWKVRLDDILSGEA